MVGRCFSREAAAGAVLWPGAKGDTMRDADPTERLRPLVSSGASDGGINIDGAPTLDVVPWVGKKTEDVGEVGSS